MRVLPVLFLSAGPVLRGDSTSGAGSDWPEILRTGVDVLKWLEMRGLG
jgi:hypothetical protein